MGTRRVSRAAEQAGTLDISLKISSIREVKTWSEKGNNYVVGIILIKAKLFFTTYQKSFNLGISCNS